MVQGQMRPSSVTKLEEVSLVSNQHLLVLMKQSLFEALERIRIEFEELGKLPLTSLLSKILGLAPTCGSRHAVAGKRHTTIKFLDEFLLPLGSKTGLDNVAVQAEKELVATQVVDPPLL